MKKTSVRYSTDNIFQRNGDNSNRFLNPYSTKVEESTIKNNNHSYSVSTATRESNNFEENLKKSKSDLYLLKSEVNANSEYNGISSLSLNCWTVIEKRSLETNQITSELVSKETKHYELPENNAEPHSKERTGTKMLWEENQNLMKQILKLERTIKNLEKEKESNVNVVQKEEEMKAHIHALEKNNKELEEKLIEFEKKVRDLELKENNPEVKRYVSIIDHLCLQGIAKSLEEKNTQLMNRESSLLEKLSELQSAISKLENENSILSKKLSKFHEKEEQEKKQQELDEEQVKVSSQVASFMEKLHAKSQSSRNVLATPTISPPISPSLPPRMSSPIKIISKENSLDNDSSNTENLEVNSKMNRRGSLSRTIAFRSERELVSPQPPRIQVQPDSELIKVKIIFRNGSETLENRTVANSNWTVSNLVKKVSNKFPLMITKHYRLLNETKNCYLIENQLLSVYANWFSSDIIELKDVSPSVNYVSYNSAALPIETKGKIFRVPIEKAWNHSSQNIPFLQNCIDSIFSREIPSLNSLISPASKNSVLDVIHALENDIELDFSLIETEVLIALIYEFFKNLPIPLIPSQVLRQWALLAAQNAPWEAFLEKFKLIPRINQQIFHSMVTTLSVVGIHTGKIEGSRVILAGLFAPFLLKGIEDILIQEGEFAGHKLPVYKTTILSLFLQFNDNL